MTLPAGIDTGTHRLVVLDAAGDVLGWTEVTVTDALAATGVAAGALGLTVGGAVALLLAGGVLLVLRRRATRV